MKLSNGENLGPRPAMSEIRRVIVLWDYEPPVRASSNSLPDICYGFAIEAETRCRVFASQMPDECNSHDMELDSPWSFKGDKSTVCEVTGQTSGENRVEIEFQDATSIAWARVAYYEHRDSVLVFLLSFDFDACPLALICAESDEPSVQVIKNKLMTVHSKQPLDEENNLIHFRHKSVERGLYIFRGSVKRRSSVSAKIPVMNLLVTFIPPHWYQNESPTWVFRISEPTQAPTRSNTRAKASGII